MPRSTTSLSSFLTATNVRTHSTLKLTPSNGGTTLYLATATVNDGVRTYNPYLKQVGDINQSLFAATDRVSVLLRNTDNVRGLEIASGVRTYNNAEAEIGKYFYHATHGEQFRVLYRGIVAVPSVDEKEVKFDVIDPLVVAGPILGARPMSVRCPHRLKDPLTCTYAGGATTCNKIANSASGCSGLSNTAHFGGWYFPYAKVATAPTGDGGGDGGDGGWGSCFTGDTLVTLANGTQRPIKYIRKGDWVMCFYYDETTGRDVVVAEQVTETFCHDVYERYEYGFGNGARVDVTPEHPFYVAKGAFRIADYLRLRNKVKALDPRRKELADTQLVSAKWIEEPAKVYNIHVRFFNTYFADGLAVHNRKPDDTRDGGGVILYY